MNFIRQSAFLAWLLWSGGCAMFMQEPGTPLARAAHAGDIAEMRRLVAEGDDPNAYDASQQTALHWAARGGHAFGPHDCRGEATHRAAVIAALIDLGADVNATDRRPGFPGMSSGWTALHIALHHEQFNTAALLLARGADPAIRSGQGKTVVALAEEEGAPKELLAALIAGRD
jgi:ankyrin repeat protein